MKAPWSPVVRSEACREFKRVEYKMLRTITGAYHGVSHPNLSAISNVEECDMRLRMKELLGRQQG